MIHQSSSNITCQRSLSPKQDRTCLIASEIIRKHARTAANIAFSRAHGQRDVLEINPRSVQSSFDVKDKRQVGSQNIDLAIGRQDSIRFIGPNAILRDYSKNRKQESVQRLSPFDSDHLIINRSNASKNCCPKPLQLVDKSSKSKELTNNPTNPDIYDEFLTTKQDLSSIPSSYKRIQKSKSMFGTIGTPDKKYANTDPENLHLDFSPAFSSSRPVQSQYSQVPLRGFKSASFLRAKWHQSESNDSALKLARDRLIYDTTQQLKREKPSFLSRSKSKRLVKAEQNSFRNFSTDSDDPKTCSGQVQELKVRELNFREFASKASKSVRGRLERTFCWRSKSNTNVIPVQQVNAKIRHSHAHHRNHPSTSDTTGLSSQLDQDSISERVLNIPSSHQIGSDILLNSQFTNQDRLKIHSGNENSKPTSWNSTSLNTTSIEDPLKQQSESDERLSNKNKIGIRQNSLSPIRVKKINHGFQYPIVYQPIEKLNKDYDSAAVSSARVYSALMRRLEIKKTNTNIKDSRKPSGKYSCPNNGDEIPSLKPRNRDEAYFPTIKCVSLEGGKNLTKLSSDNSYCSTVSHEPDKLEIIDQSEEKKNDIINIQDSFSYDEYHQPIEYLEPEHTSTAHLDILRKKENQSPLSNSLDNMCRGSPEMKRQTECLIPSVRISGKKKSTFFSGGTVPISNAASPFRRAMQRSIYKSRENWSDLQQSIENQTPKTTYSESIYSRTTSGQINEFDMSFHSPDLEKGDKKRLQSGSSSIGGDALIIEQGIYTPPIPPKSIYRRISSIDSNEWRPWISSEVAKLEQGKENFRSISSSEHELSTSMTPQPSISDCVRRDVQTENKDVQALKGPSNKSVQPLCIIEQQRLNARNFLSLGSDLTKKSIAVHAEAQRDRSEPNTYKPLTQKSSRPLRPVFSLNATQSMTSMKNIASINSSDSSINVLNTNTRHYLSENMIRCSKSQPLPTEKKPKHCLENSALDLHNQYFDGKPSASSITKSGLDKIETSKFRNACTKLRHRGSGHRLFGVEAENFSQVYEPDWTRRTISGRLNEPLDLKKVGSKKMVEMFLNSRRKRMISSCGDNTAIDGDDGSVFL
ncbi:hypothetical protein GcM3_054015 [Golovinomyces cichoracearum]|uniref:Uncharacterized protein n=1 Tax=Golovinomyces cichoracearum TaxID=62708 RepID=A0A420IYN3_9PEZI|nr:hypothetical protein GcM3_054015 [Golovinomyces cichoracearum]